MWDRKLNRSNESCLRKKPKPLSDIAHETERIEKQAEKTNRRQQQKRAARYWG